jgi:hypothetical protein
VAGASLIVEEAGGKVLDPSGNPFSLTGRRMLATNAHLAQQAVAVLGHMPLGPQEPRPPGAAGSKVEGGPEARPAGSNMPEGEAAYVMSAV